MGVIDSARQKLGDYRVSYGNNFGAASGIVLQLDIAWSELDVA